EIEKRGGGRARREATGGIAGDLWIRTRSWIPPLSRRSVCGRIWALAWSPPRCRPLEVVDWILTPGVLLDLQEAFWYFSIAFF
ncbi:unnamed protein product, partial [Musa textilis]